MKDWLLMAAVAGAGFFGTLGVSAVRGKFSHPAPVSLQAVAGDAAMPAASNPQPDGAESVDPPSAPSLPAPSLPAPLPPAPSFPAPTYDQQTAARDWAAAHSARSR